MDGGSLDSKVMLVFGKYVGSVAIQDVAAEATNGNPAAQTCNANSSSLPLVVIGISAYLTGAGAFSTASPAFDAEVTDSARITLGYKVYNSGQADHSIDKDDEGSANYLGSFYVEGSP